MELQQLAAIWSNNKTVFYLNISIFNRKMLIVNRQSSIVLPYTPYSYISFDAGMSANRRTIPGLYPITVHRSPFTVHRSPFPSYSSTQNSGF
jgi:hypothetical protein